MAGCVPGSGGRWAGSDEEAVKVYLIRFIADLSSQENFPYDQTKTTTLLTDKIGCI